MSCARARARASQSAHDSCGGREHCGDASTARPTICKQTPCYYTLCLRSSRSTRGAERRPPPRDLYGAASSTSFTWFAGNAPSRPSFVRPTHHPSSACVFETISISSPSAKAAREGGSARRAACERGGGQSNRSAGRRRGDARGGGETRESEQSTPPTELVLADGDILELRDAPGR